jgi:inosose dehydratase
MSAPQSVTSIGIHCKLLPIEERTSMASVPWQVGSAPDSWGVWFGDDPRQLPAERFLDEVSAVGYRWIELGPHGYLPTDAGKVAEALQRRGLRASGTFVTFDLQAPGAWEAARPEVERTCRQLQRLGAPHLVIIDASISDMRTGERLGDPELDPRAWRRLVEATRRVLDAADRHGLAPVFHPHVDTHVERAEQTERLLDDLDELRLCLDVGHFTYGGGDPVAFFREHSDRVAYLHLKSVDPEVRDRVKRDAAPFCRAVADGVFVEPSHGAVDFVALRDALLETGYDGFAIVEQDMYPASFDAPLPIAERTLAYLREVGLA